MSLPIVASLSEITELEYIQSSGTQHIDTGFKPNQNTTIAAEFVVLDASNNGAYLYGGGTGTARLEAYPWGGTLEFNYGSAIPLVGTVYPNKRFYICQDKIKYTLSYFDGSGEWTGNHAEQSFTSAYTLAIFALNRGTVAYPTAGMKLYSCQIYDNGTLIRDYIPAKLSDGTVGLYDKLSGLLYINAGTGTFTAGPEVQKDPSENPILYLVTDRTAADVDAGNEKGTYNASDLNRVGNTVAYLVDKFREAGYSVSVSPKTDWTEQDWPTPFAIAHYLADVSVLRGLFAQMQSTPTVPSDMDGFLFQEANDIEKILLDISTLLDNIIAAWYHSGETYSGEV